MTKAAKPKNPHAEALGKLSAASMTDQQLSDRARKGGIAKASKMRDLQAEIARLNALLDRHGIRETHDDMQK